MFKPYSGIIIVFILLIFGRPNSVFGQGKSDPVKGFKSPLDRKGNNTIPHVIRPAASTITQVFALKIEKLNGSFQQSLKTLSLSKEQLEMNLSHYLGVSDDHTFSKMSEDKDDLGFTHLSYQQYYKGVPVDGGMILSHFRNGKAESINGQIADVGYLETKVSLSKDDALGLAKKYLNVTDVINSYPVELVIAKAPSETAIHKLVYKVRIDAATPFTMCYVYIDANNGSVTNRVNLIVDADALGTANTLYSGTQSITHDSFSGGFRLRDNARKIETYDATTATYGTNGFTGQLDFTNTTSTWNPSPRLVSFTISTVAQNWWYSAFSDEKPDLYLILKDGNDNVILKSNYLTDTNPPITYNLNILLTNPPYKVEIWDADALDADDFGGITTIPNNIGTAIAWANNGNTGSFKIDTQNNPALDVHWGMEKTYDFYKTVFNRNSFDGNGSAIKQLINPPTLQARYGQSPNNAFAMQDLNIMVYGLGDGVQWGPVVGLDVEGHEFTHLVTANNGHNGLAYQGESGALNESFSDIMGTSIEFYSGVDPDWTIGEGITHDAPFLRSLSDPNASQNPDTYQKLYWVRPTDLSNDNGGVHTNSGVQNFWFYLLSQGGTGINDLGKAYSVTGIGISQAQKIAYRNLTTYLTQNATYLDAFAGSLQSAEDLFGNPSSQYSAVRAAWYAVGIGNDPISYCSGSNTLTASSGTVFDGSGLANYSNNSSCKWVIAPPGANTITLNFTAFNTESTNDIVYAYDGPDDTAPVLMTWWGNTLPPAIHSTGGALTIKFITNGSVTGPGWSTTYTATGVTPGCGGGNLLASPSGFFDDGSGAGNYGNNQFCYWLIAPPCATSVTLNVTQLQTELNYDGLIVYNGPSTSSPLLGVFSGATLPAAVTANSGQMLVLFESDYSTTLQGFAANYTSTGSAVCSGTTIINSSDAGTITDGSGNNNYCNNLDCKWLIQPPQAIKVTLSFTAFDLENPSADGKSIYDAVEVYDGTTTASPLLGRFAGDNLPPSVTSSGGSLLVRFYSDPGEVKQGWSANYTSKTTTYCTGPTTLTTVNGTFNDGSGTNLYGNNTQCSWLIKPANASKIALSFSDFNTELNSDGVIVYDGETNTAPILGKFSGATIPTVVNSTGGSMYVEFITNPSVRGNGWTASYISTVIVGLEESVVDDNLKFYPNPSHGIFTVKSEYNSVSLQIIDILGKEVLKSRQINRGETQLDISDLSKGIYLIGFKIKDQYKIERLIIQ